MSEADRPQADAQGRATWLASSNPANLAFYRAHGFRTVERFFMGADDPTWDAPPFPIDLVRGLLHSVGRRGLNVSVDGQGGARTGPRGEARAGWRFGHVAVCVENVAIW